MFENKLERIFPALCLAVAKQPSPEILAYLLSTLDREDLGILVETLAAQGVNDKTQKEDKQPLLDLAIALNEHLKQ